MSDDLQGKYGEQSPISGSEPISNNGPDEMALLMNDLDDAEDIFQNKKIKQETGSTIYADDWDSEADDILKSDTDLSHFKRGTKEEFLHSTDSATSAVGKSLEELPVPSREEGIDLAAVSKEVETIIPREVNERRKFTNTKSSKETLFDNEDSLLPDMGSLDERGGKNKGANFLDSLLSSSVHPKEENKVKKEFVLPETYKLMSNGDKRGSTVDHLKSGSPRKNFGLPDSVEELFSSDTARPRRMRGSSSSGRQQQFEVDDDDIIKSSRPRREKDKNLASWSSNKSQATTVKADDWLNGETPKEKASKKSDWLKELMSAENTAQVQTPSITQDHSKGSIPENAFSKSQTTQFDAQKSAISDDALQLIHQLQEEQQKMIQLLLPNGMLTNGTHLAVENEELIKQLKIDLHKVTIECGMKESELELLKKQHERHLEMTEAMHRKQLEQEREVWARAEERNQNERTRLIDDHKFKIEELQSANTRIVASYEANMAALKAEWAENVSRAKEIYHDVIERMKNEHKNAIERLTELKNIELQAVATATGKAKEAEVVMDHLEVNTERISNLTSLVEERSESAHNLTKRALEMKEKQLREMEAQVGVAKAEAESERNRLTILISRLEATLANQGTEMESEKWRLAQEMTKLDLEKKTLLGERNQFRVFMEGERRVVTQTKETLWNEQKQMMRDILKQKAGVLSLANAGGDPTEKEQELQDLRRSLDENQIFLQDEEEKLRNAKRSIERNMRDLEEGERQLRKREEALEENEKENRKGTQLLQLQRAALSQEKLKLEQLEAEATAFINEGLCPSCKSDALSVPQRLRSLPRLPGDGREVLKIAESFSGANKKNFDRKSVMERLQKAREEEVAWRAQTYERVATLDLF